MEYIDQLLDDRGVNDYDPQYPLGGMVEPYDIEREKELTN